MLVLSKGRNRLVLPFPSPEDGNRCGSRNIVFSSIQNSGLSIECKKPVILNFNWLALVTVM
jgi:hypothetical protein